MVFGSQSLRIVRTIRKDLDGVGIEAIEQLDIPQRVADEINLDEVGSLDCGFGRLISHVAA